MKTNCCTLRREPEIQRKSKRAYTHNELGVSGLLKGPGNYKCFLWLVLRVTIPVMKHHDKKGKLRRKGFSWLVFPHCSSLMKGKTGTQAEEEPEGRN